MQSHIKNDSARRVLCEDTLTLPEAAKVVAEILGHRPDRSSLYRWCMRGVKGVKLDHVRIGNRVVTSRQALTRFFDAQTSRSASDFVASAGESTDD